MAQEEEAYNPLIPNNPLLCDIFPQNLIAWPCKVDFRGWLLPQRKWKEWIDNLSPNYAAVWKQTGIYNAIMSSSYQVPRNVDIVLGLAEFWLPDTNTFVFPLGEATVTLEDVMILGGFPILGESVTTHLREDEMIKIEILLEKERVKLCRRYRKAAQCSWLTQFMGKDDDLEHVAFLSLWLSRFVFPCKSECIGNIVFPIAVKLSRGRKVALAQAILASIYRDLRVIKEGVIALRETIQVLGPFQLLKLWAFERFSTLWPKSPNPVGEPRVARWHNLSLKVNNLLLIRLALWVKESFEWRPYTVDIANWRHLSYYGETPQTLFLNNSSSDEERSLFICLSSCELAGIDTKERYYPHRVARQFGLIQDIPYNRKEFDFSCEGAKLCVPPREFRSFASNRYVTWWNKMLSNRKKVLEGILKKDKYAEVIKACRGLVSDGVTPISYSQCFENFIFGNNNVHNVTKEEPVIHDLIDFDDAPPPPGFRPEDVPTSSNKRSPDKQRGTGKKVKTGIYVENKRIDKDSEQRSKQSEKGKSAVGKGLSADDPIEIDDSKDYTTQVIKEGLFGILKEVMEVLKK